MKKRLKAITALALTAILMFTAAGCGGSESKETPAAASSSVKEETAEQETAVSSAAEEAEEEVIEEEPAEGVTAASLAQAAAEKAGEADSYASSIKMLFDTGLSAKTQGITMSMDMNMHMGVDSEFTRDPLAGYSVGTMSMSVGDGSEDGYNEEETTEMYFVQEENGLVRYGTTDGGETWTMSPAEEDEMAADSLGEADLFRKISEGTLTAELAEETETFKGEEVYVLNSTLKGEELKTALETSMEGAADSIFGSDAEWESLEAPMTVYIYKESGLPAGTVIDMKDFGSVMLSSMLGVSEEDAASYDLDVRQFDIEVFYWDYGKIGEITVPDEVKAAAVPAENDDSGVFAGDTIPAVELTDEDFEVRDYLLSNTYSDIYFLIIKNNSDTAAGIDGTATVYGKEDNVIGISNTMLDVIGPGEESITYFYLTVDEEIDHVDYELDYDTDIYYDPVLSGIDIEQSVSGSNVIVKVTNNGEYPAEFLEAYVLFFDADGNLIEYDNEYAVDDDYELKPGESYSFQSRFSGDGFDHAECYLEGRHSKE